MNPLTVIGIWTLAAVGLWMAVRLWSGARGLDWPFGTRPIFRAIRTALLLLLVGALFMTSAISFLGVIVSLLAAVTLVEAVTEYRAARRRTICALLALSVGRGQQLDSSALLAGLPENDKVGRASAKLFGMLGLGVPLVEAIQRAPKALPREAVAYAVAGDSGEAQAAALKELSHGDRSNLAAVWRSYLDRLCYLAAVLTMLALVMTFLMIKIVPEFEKIFEDFDLELPKLTLLAVSVSQFTVTYLGVPLLLLAVFGLLAAMIVGVCYLTDRNVLRWSGRSAAAWPANG